MAEEIDKVLASDESLRADYEKLAILYKAEDKKLMQTLPELKKVVDRVYNLKMTEKTERGEATDTDQYQRVTFSPKEREEMAKEVGMDPHQFGMYAEGPEWTALREASEARSRRMAEAAQRVAELEINRYTLQHDGSLLTPDQKRHMQSDHDEIARIFAESPDPSRLRREAKKILAQGLGDGSTEPTKSVVGVDGHSIPVIGGEHVDDGSTIAPPSIKVAAGKKSAPGLGADGLPVPTGSGSAR